MSKSSAPVRTPWAAGKAAIWLAAVLLSAAFIAVVLWRATPVQLAATLAPLEYQLSDGSRLTLEPGSSAQVIREFSLWWGDKAATRAVILQRGRGTIVASADAPPFVIETPDAHLDISDATVKLDADQETGTHVTVVRGRVLVTARDLMHVVRRNGDGVRLSSSGMMANQGSTVIASEGTLELMADVADEDVDTDAPCVKTCSN